MSDTIKCLDIDEEPEHNENKFKAPWLPVSYLNAFLLTANLILVSCVHIDLLGLVFFCDFVIQLVVYYALRCKSHQRVENSFSNKLYCGFQVKPPLQGRFTLAFPPTARSNLSSCARAHHNHECDGLKRWARGQWGQKSQILGKFLPLLISHRSKKSPSTHLLTQ